MPASHRQPYIQTWREGARTPAPSRLAANFLVNTHYGIHSLDHDDGSNAFVDTGNVVAFAGMKNFLGFAKQTINNLFVRPDFAGRAWAPQGLSSSAWAGGTPGVAGSTAGATASFGVPLPRAYYFPYCARSLGQESWGAALADVFVNNTCVLNTSGFGLYRFGTCNPASPGASGAIPHAAGNTFYVPGANASFVCGRATLTLAEAQAVGYDTASSTHDSRHLGPEDVAAMIHARLTF